MANRPLTKKEKDAWDWAKSLHSGQIRKFTNKPYFEAHVKRVNGIVKQYTTDEDLLISAILHDVPEDCFEDYEVGLHEIEEKFGKKISNIVRELTSVKDEIEHFYFGSKSDYLVDKMLNISDDALTIKLADRLQNISDAFTASERFRNKYFYETVKIMRNIRSHRRFNKVQEILANQIEHKLMNIDTIFKIKRFDEI